MADRKEGTTLGGYRIISQIGKGGMATVYKAYQPSMERYVALKVLPQYHAQDPQFTQRFIQEARIIASLEHRNILPVYDFGEENGVTYMVMRYLETGTLQDILALGKPTLPETVDVITQICAALDYAHRRGVVHRDVKPANVMVDEEGTVYLTDFGLAKVLENSPQLTASGAVMGTPLYMSPEQSRGIAVDGRSDIYAVGVVLYEMVTGRPPFQAETPLAVVLAHIHDPLPLPQEINPDVPDEIQRVILKALAKDPDDRYQTAHELAEALSEAAENVQQMDAEETSSLQALSQEVRTTLASREILPTEERFTPVPTRSPSVPETAPASSSRLILTGVGVLALVAIAIFLGTMYFAKHPQAGSGNHAASISEPILYDDFNTSDYDGTVNTRIWQTDTEPACKMAQQDGVLVVTNEKVDYDIETCDLRVGIPATVNFANVEDIAAELLIAGNYQGSEAGQGLMLSSALPDGNAWYGLCGPELTEGETVASFWVARVTPEGITLEDYYASTEIRPDQWYTYRLELHQEDNTLTCFLNDTPIGVFDLRQSGTFAALPFERGLTAWRGPDATATTKVDDFWLIP